ncbi:MAG: DinB family protein [Pyrinomonadaceae bacterium]|jgi:hypothetical protein
MKFSLSKTTEILGATPKTLHAWLGELSNDWTCSFGRQDEWQPYDIIAHLIHADETNWIPRAKVILARADDIKFPPFDRYGQFEKNNGKTIIHLLNEFSTVRYKNIEVVKSWNLTPENLELKGIHPEFGEVTLAQLLSTWVVHDLTHIRQIATALARRYETAVGPWKAYLSILN